MKHAVLLLTMVLLSACGTLNVGHVQAIKIDTEPPTQANCTLGNALGSWAVTTPAVVRVYKSHTPLNITCMTPDGKEGHATVQAAHLSGGMRFISTTDPFTGAMVRYPSFLRLRVFKTSKDMTSSIKRGISAEEEQKGFVSPEDYRPVKSIPKTSFVDRVEAVVRPISERSGDFQKTLDKTEEPSEALIP